MLASSAQVPKQLHGYSLQFTECICALLDAKAGAVVSVEVFEDVGVVSADNFTDATQVKAGSGANPISDGAIDLWKTFRNWIDQCNGLVLNPARTNFKIFVNAKAKGKLCSLMSEAQDETSIANCIAKIREQFIDKRSGKLKPSLGQEVKQHLNVVLDTLNESLLALIIGNFTYKNGGGSAYFDLLARFKSFPIADGVIELAMVYIVGWTKIRIDELIQSDRLARIYRDEFWLQLTTYCQKAQLQPYLARYAYAPTQQEIDAELLRIYVRQLGFVDAGRDQEIEAVTDYLSTKAAIVGYIERNVINDTSLDEYAEDLKKHWKLRKRGLEADADSQDDLQFGKRLLNRCLIENLPLQGVPTPSFFTPGCFHELADKRDVGWHPHYLVLLEEL